MKSSSLASNSISIQEITFYPFAVLRLRARNMTPLDNADISFFNANIFVNKVCIIRSYDYFGRKMLYTFPETLR